MKYYVDAGVKQVVLLGAGFDTRAYRLGHSDLEFVEIDHADTQKEKVRRLNKIRDLPHANVRYCSVDFRSDWLIRVMEAKVIKNVKTIVVWEGVSMYLNHDEIEYTLQAVRALCPSGANIIFDCLPQQFYNELKGKKKKGMDNIINPEEEPFMCDSSQKHINKILERNGFKLIEKMLLIDYRKKLNELFGYKIPDLSMWPLFLNDACIELQG